MTNHGIFETVFVSEGYIILFLAYLFDWCWVLFLSQVFLSIATKNIDILSLDIQTTEHIMEKCMNFSKTIYAASPLKRVH